MMRTAEFILRSQHDKLLLELEQHTIFLYWTRKQWRPELSQSESQPFSVTTGFQTPLVMTTVKFISGKKLDKLLQEKQQQQENLQYPRELTILNSSPGLLFDLGNSPQVGHLCSAPHGFSLAAITSWPLVIIHPTTNIFFLVWWFLSSPPTPLQSPTLTEGKMWSVWPPQVFPKCSEVPLRTSGNAQKLVKQLQGPESCATKKWVLYFKEMVSGTSNLIKEITMNLGILICRMGIAVQSNAWVIVRILNLYIWSVKSSAWHIISAQLISAI